METTSLYINSKDRQTGNINNFNITIQPLGINKCKSWCLKNASIPFSYYSTVYPASSILPSQQFVLQETPFALHNIVIPAGNYNAVQLANTLQTILNAVSAFVFTVTYSTTTGKFTIAATGLFQLFFLGTTNAAYPEQRIGLIMGFLGDVSPATTSTTSDIVANLSGPKNLFIKCQQLQYSSNNFFQDQKDIVIATIPITIGPFGVAYYEDQTVWSNKYDMPLAGQFTFLLVDEYNRLVNMNGQDYSFTILLSSNSQI